jgi:hypothetical protein
MQSKSRTTGWSIFGVSRLTGIIWNIIGYLECKSWWDWKYWSPVYRGMCPETTFWGSSRWGMPAEQQEDKDLSLRSRASSVNTVCLDSGSFHQIKNCLTICPLTVGPVAAECVGSWSGRDTLAHPRKSRQRFEAFSWKEFCHTATENNAAQTRNPMLL